MYQVINQLGIQVKLLNEFAKIPTRGSEQAAGYDLSDGRADCFPEIPGAGTAGKSTGTGPREFRGEAASEICGTVQRSGKL